MSVDRRYTLHRCYCGDAFCAGCDPEAWPALGDSPRDRMRGQGEIAMRKYEASNPLRRGPTK